MQINNIFDLKGVFNNLLSSLIWLAFAVFGAFLFRVVRNALRGQRIDVFWKTSYALVLISVALALLFRASWVPILICLISSLVAVRLVLRGIIDVGIVDAHASTEQGISFSSSLKMARTSFAFLGIGADKLTRDPEFEDAIGRCAGAGRSARFLLSPVDNPLLEDLAKQHGLSPNEYSNKVSDSLRKLADLRRRRNLNIEVRQYRSDSHRDLQQFRLLFLNDETCLLGWTVWGAHAGRKNPQIVLRWGSSIRKEKQLYAAFKAHYEATWENSKPIDLSSI